MEVIQRLQRLWIQTLCKTSRCGPAAPCTEGKAIPAQASGVALQDPMQARQLRAEHWHQAVPTPVGGSPSGWPTDRVPTSSWSALGRLLGHIFPFCIIQKESSSLFACWVTWIKRSRTQPSVASKTFAWYKPKCSSSPTPAWDSLSSHWRSKAKFL